MKISDMTHDEIVRAQNLASFEKRQNHGTAQLREMIAPHLRKPETDRFDVRVGYGVSYNETFEEYDNRKRCGEGYPVIPEIAMLLEKEVLALSADENLILDMELDVWVRSKDILLGVNGCDGCISDSPARGQCRCSAVMEKVHELVAKYEKLAGSGPDGSPAGRFNLNIGFGEPEQSGRPDLNVELYQAFAEELMKMKEKGPGAKEEFHNLIEKYRGLGLAIEAKDADCPSPPPRDRVRLGFPVMPELSALFAKELLPMFADEELLIVMTLNIGARMKSCYECALNAGNYDFCRCSEPMDKVHGLISKYHILNWLKNDEIKRLKADIGKLAEYMPIIERRRKDHEAICAKIFGWGKQN